MYKLFDGYQSLPWILLQNPTESHNKSYKEMFAETPTLKSLETELEHMGVSLGDIPVIDVFPLVTDEDLSKLSSEKQKKVTELSFSITKDFFRTYKPEWIISMQCHSRNPNKKLRGGFSDNAARILGSSHIDAVGRAISRVKVWDLTLNIIKSRHPSGRNRNRDSPESQKPRLQDIRDIFQRRYFEFGQQKLRDSVADCGLLQLSTRYEQITIADEKDVTGCINSLDPYAANAIADMNPRTVSTNEACSNNQTTVVLDMLCKMSLTDKGKPGQNEGAIDEIAAKMRNLRLAKH